MVPTSRDPRAHCARETVLLRMSGLLNKMLADLGIDRMILNGEPRRGPRREDRPMVDTYNYPAEVERDEDGRYVVTFPDFGWGTTDGATLEEALREARDLLRELMATTMREGKGLPAPTLVGEQPHLVVPPVTIALKAALYEACRETGVSAANADEMILSAIAEVSPDEHEGLAETLATLHNSGDIDFLRVCQSDRISARSGTHLYRVRRVFCNTLTRVECSAKEAVAIARVISERTEEAITVGSVYDALREWFGQTPQRAESGLELVQGDMRLYSAAVKPVLLAGAPHDVRKYAKVALGIARQAESSSRLDAITALGVMDLQRHEDLLVDALRCFEETIEQPISDNDGAVIVRAAIGLLQGLGAEGSRLVEPLLVKACKFPNPDTLHEIVSGVNSHKRVYTERMVDASFSAIASAVQYHRDTIDFIDGLLYEWDIRGDRERVLALVIKLLSRDDESVTVDRLDAFGHRIRNESADLLGWYVVSMLKTGEIPVCLAASELLPHDEAPKGLDIDLSDYCQDGNEVLFLCRKIIGYCLANRRCAAALLISCMRAVPDDLSPELETTVFDYFLVNYPSSIDWFEKSVSSKDRARPMVTRLSDKLRKYLSGTQELGFCEAFRPSERQIRLQHHQQINMWRTKQRQAYERSIASYIAQESTVLYGTGSIYYLYTGDDSSPRRQVSKFGSYKQELEIPRLEVLDPVGLDRAVRRFWSEARPS